jgi:hypothetical protein
MQRVRALLMGGQACILYGAAEFSRDIDLAILTDPYNLTRLRRALSELKAEVIAVPPFHARYLRRGHAVHFRCKRPEAEGIRIDIMSRMRGVESFPKLWARRTTIALPDKFRCDVISLPDLVKAKKTQRDKDWPMIRRLVEAHYFENRENPSRNKVKFWLLELRTPDLLIETAGQHPHACRRLMRDRPLLAHALSGDSRKIAEELDDEKERERELDRLYWAPLRREMEALRLSIKGRPG